MENDRLSEGDNTILTRTEATVAGPDRPAGIEGTMGRGVLHAAPAPRAKCSRGVPTYRSVRRTAVLSEDNSRICEI